MRNAVPGTKVAVRYVDDEVDHDFVLVWPVSLLHWFVVSPDDDCWVEDLSLWSFQYVMNVWGNLCSTGSGANWVEKNC